MYEEKDYGHVPVLLHECLDALALRPDGVYVDGTLGRAGHSLEIAKRLTTGRLIGIDRDETAITAAEEAIKAGTLTVDSAVGDESNKINDLRESVRP